MFTCLLLKVLYCVSFCKPNIRKELITYRKCLCLFYLPSFPNSPKYRTDPISDPRSEYRLNLNINQLHTLYGSSATLKNVTKKS